MTIPEAPFLPTYAQAPVCFVRGDGALLFDTEEKSYIDCVAGIAVVSVGHCNPEVTQAIQEQAARLVHVSNLYWTEPSCQLARKITELCAGQGRVFFANSGAEANECAIKLARKRAGAGRFKIICADGGFHGRTLATLAATGQPSKRIGFEPEMPGFVHGTFNDLDSFAALVDHETAAIMLEPVQGECGVIPATPAFLRGIRELCDKHDLALVFDEVQTGVGRTGSWWAYQQYGVVPDILTSAKALANGLPLGACIALSESAQEAFKPGDHATTFGGGPVPCAAALAVLDYMEAEGVLVAVQEKGEFFQEQLRAIPQVIEVRGKGLMIAAVLDQDSARDVVNVALGKGLLINAVSDNTIRFVPPLVISRDQIIKTIQIFQETLST